jgi:hypothetical protein
MHILVFGVNKEPDNGFLGGCCSGREIHSARGSGTLFGGIALSLRLEGVLLQGENNAACALTGHEALRARAKELQPNRRIQNPNALVSMEMMMDCQIRDLRRESAL